MRKATRNNSLRGLRVSAIGGLSLAVVLAAGCSSNRMPGNGEPANDSHIGSAGTATTPGTSSGTSGATTPANPPMLSSASGDPAATMAAIQPHTGRVLGPADPAPTGAPNAPNPPTGQYQNPALAANPQVTVNSSISSAPTPALVSGAGGDAGGVAVGGAAVTTGAV